ncbi:MAG TPA: serine hydrolase domain-containing protein [Bacteroidales bacterium]|nr:serine hydrolase domain-containing protein [Bacteroidales bacterium]
MGIGKREIRIIFIVVILLIAAVSPVGTERAGLVNHMLVPAHTRIDNSLNDNELFITAEKGVEWFMNNYDLKGTSIAVARDGKLVYAHGFGYSSVSDSAPAEPYNRFRVASISKLVTAIAIMKLHEEGKLSVNDRVFGPEGILTDSIYSNPKDKKVFDITVGHLLGHMGGWTQRYGDQMFMPLVVAKTMGVPLPVDIRTIVRFALSKRLHFTPGAGQSYSNLGYSILGLVIEKVSGMSYEAYCVNNILEPLGIYDMALGHNLPEEKLPFEVSYYEVADAKPKPSVYGTGEMLMSSRGGNDIEALGAAGAWVATTPDLLRLLLAVDGFDSRKDILSDESIDFMTDSSNGYAPVGWRAALQNGTWWRTGSFPGTIGMMKRMPDGTAWVVLFNTSAWNGPELSSDIDYMISKFIQRVGSWPEKDLFSYSLPVPIK